MPDLQPLHAVSRRHLDGLSDHVGIMQHARGSRPDPAHGYCTDDVARALQVDLLHQRELGWDAIATSAWRNYGFLEAAFRPPTGRFRNFRAADGTWLDDGGSDDAQGRAMLALGETIDGAADPALVRSAERLFAAALPAARELGAIRAQASVLLACDAAMRTAPARATSLARGILAERLESTFRSRPASDWPWPEPRLTYENALPARAMLVAGRSLASQPLIDAGLEVLDWLIVCQTASAGHLSPIGNAWWSRGGAKSSFDQQPIEATALLLAAAAAYEIAEEQKYRSAAERSYAWFLGANDAGLSVADPEQGACYDGLTPRGVNTNQGAESTLMWLIALESIRALRHRRRPNPRPSDEALATMTP